MNRVTRANESLRSLVIYFPINSILQEPRYDFTIEVERIEDVVIK